MSYKRPESILVVIYTLSGDVLMLRRHEPANFWQSVTGSLEAGETPREAAARELGEETGLQAGSLVDCHEQHNFEIFPIWRHRYAPGVSENTEHVFRLALESPLDITIDRAEHEEYQWLPKASAVSLTGSHTNRDAILAWVPDPS